MTKLNLKGTTFNDKIIYPVIDDIHILIDKENTILPVGIYNELKNKLKENLKLNDEIEFSLISKDLEELMQNDVKIDFRDSIDEIYKVILDELDNKIINIQHESLKRVKELYDNRKIDDAIEIFKTIEIDTLSKFEFEEYKLLEFKLFDDKKKFFDGYKALFERNHTKLKELYFVYLKYLEDIRDDKRPKKLIENIEEEFSIEEEFNRDEKAIFYYLRGRNFYARGEFLDALRDFKKSLEYCSNEKLLASIYNSATNSFTDNLFFDEAFFMANKAFEIRKKLKLSEKSDSLSLIGGIYLKRKNFKRAYEAFKEVEEITDKKDNRIYNYLVKSTIMLGFYNKAKEYLNIAKKYDDRLGFTILAEMFLIYKTQNYEKLFDYAKEKFLITDKKSSFDKVVLGWGYFLLAQKASQEEKYLDSYKFLNSSIEYFLLDKYILEAYYAYLKIDKDNEYSEYFLNVNKEYNLKGEFDEYIKKHSSISIEYKDTFGFISSKSNNLENFEQNLDNYFLI
jgi:hypothetical protein